MEGLRFGRLTVISFYRTKDAGGKHRAYCDCACDCGNTKRVQRHHLTSGSIRSCGCLRDETTASRNLTHGMRRHYLYGRWAAMVSRCTNKNHSSYKRYGGRGVTVCSRWKDSFAAFLEDMGEPASPELTIERMDNNKGYEPGNCKWATRREQGQNTSHCKLTKEAAKRIASDPRRQRDIAADEGISQAHVSAIKRSKVWTNHKEQ